MSDARAQLKNYRQSPRKVRLVADLIRGKKADQALALLANLPKRASEPMSKLLLSAIANAKGTSAHDLVISGIAVDSGIVFKRSLPRARGRASAIRKKSSHITLALTELKAEAKAKAK